MVLVIGFVLVVFFGKGQKVFVGGCLVVLENIGFIDVLRKVWFIFVFINVEIVEIEVLFGEECCWLEGYVLVVCNNVCQVELQFVGFEFVKENVKFKLECFQKLVKKGLVLVDDVEVVKLFLKFVIFNLECKKIYIQELKELIVGGDIVWFFIGNVFVGCLGEMEVKVVWLKLEQEY